MAFRGAWNLALLTAVTLAAAATAEPSGGSRAARRDALGTVQPAPFSSGERSLDRPDTLRLDARSGLTYSRELQIGEQRLRFRARGPLPRTAARRRFLGVQLELRF